MVGAGINTGTQKLKQYTAEAQSLHRQFQAISSRIKPTHVPDYPDVKSILERHEAHRNIERPGDIRAIRLVPPLWIKDLVGKAASELKLCRPPQTYLSRHAFPNESHDLVLPTCSGVYKERACSIYLKHDLPVREMAITLAHETYHHAGIMKDLPDTEWLAESFVLRFAEKFS